MKMEIEAQIAELLSMFPQHNRNVVLKLYGTISQTFGHENNAVVFESCIERLLEMNESNLHHENVLQNLNEFGKNNIIIEDDLELIQADIVIEDDGKKKRLSNPLLNEDSNDSLEIDLINMDQSYRNRSIKNAQVKPSSDNKNIFKKGIAKHVYRDPCLKSPDLFPDDDDDIMFNEDIETLDHLSKKNNIENIPTHSTASNCFNTLESDGSFIMGSHESSRSKKRKHFSTPISSAPPKKVPLCDEYNEKVYLQSQTPNPQTPVTTPKTRTPSTKSSSTDPYCRTASNTLNTPCYRTPSIISTNAPCTSNFSNKLNNSRISISSSTTSKTNPNISQVNNMSPIQQSQSTLLNNKAPIQVNPNSFLIPKNLQTPASKTQSSPQVTPPNNISPILTNLSKTITVNNATAHVTFTSSITQTSSTTSVTNRSPSVQIISPPTEDDMSRWISDFEDFVEQAVKQIKNVIEDVDLKFARQQVEVHKNMQLQLQDVVQRIVTQLLDDKSYPKEPKKKPQLPAPKLSIENLRREPWYSEQIKTVLKNHFPMIAVESINKFMTKNKNDFTKIYKEIEDNVNNKSPAIKFMKKPRRKSLENSSLHESIQNELAKISKEKQKSDEKVASSLNDKQYEQEGQAIECGCCYIEASFETMIQCDEGHLFCTECLQRYSKEVAFGEGKAELFCMTDGCDGTFPQSQLVKALPTEIISKYFERQQEEYIQLANIENLVRCPSCNYAAVMAEGDKVFKCQNVSCMKETCRYCQEEWEGHFGLKCSEVEKKQVTSLRKTYEEKMTEAKVRKCWKCKTIFLKSDGCNKMTCRCGAKMCYVCRQPKIDYNHFCQHARDPGQPCTSCTRCSLWSDPSEDDDRAVAEIQKQAEEEKKKIADATEQGSAIPKIGPTIVVKPKVNNVPPNAVNNGAVDARHGLANIQLYPFRDPFGIVANVHHNRPRHRRRQQNRHRRNNEHYEESSDEDDTDSDDNSSDSSEDSDSDDERFAGVAELYPDSSDDNTDTSDDSSNTSDDDEY